MSQDSCTHFEKQGTLLAQAQIYKLQMLWGFLADFLSELSTVAPQYLHGKQGKALTHCIFQIVADLHCLQKVDWDCYANSGNCS